MGSVRILVDSTVERAGEALAQQLRSSGWTVVLARETEPWPTEGELTACIWLRASGDAPIPPALVDHPAEPPLIVFGGARPPPCVQLSCWLPRAPALVAMTALLQQLGEASEEASPVSWRRKTDMIVGRSAATRQLLQSLDRLAPATAPVTVTGESGTGKELVARALHYCGPRAREPFLAINCAAIPGPLFEAQLFGYQRGAFTGALSAHAGAFEAAHKGTLFLDEIGDMPRAMQAKLLRVLETGEVMRLGSNEPRKVAVRIVAATNRNLEAEVRASRFREDLYYRLRVYPVHVSPLRERPEDVPPIVNHYVALIAARERRPVPRITDAAVEKLLSYSWPGNVRELVNVIERAFLIEENALIDASHIAFPMSRPPQLIPAYRHAKAKFEADYYSQVLRTAGGNVSLAAKLAQKTRKEVYDALKRLGIDAVAYRTGTAGADGEAGEEEEDESLD